MTPSKSADTKNAENKNSRSAKDGSGKATENHGERNKNRDVARPKSQNGGVSEQNEAQKKNRQRPQKATNAKPAAEAKKTSEVKTTSEMKPTQNASDNASAGKRDSGKRGRRNSGNAKDEVASSNNAGKNAAKGTAQGASQNAAPQKSADKPSQKQQKQAAVSEVKERNQKHREKRVRDAKSESSKVEKSPQAPRKAVSAAAKNGGVGEVTSGIFSAAPIRRDDSFFSRFDTSEEKIKGKKQKQVTEEEPQLVDRNRPLAEQIAEEIELRRAEQKKAEDKTEIVGVRFRDSGKIYYFDPQGLHIEADSKVIVETQRGIEYAFAAIGNTMVSTSKVIMPLRPVIRTATPADTERYKNNKKLEGEAAEIFKDRVAKLGLEMALVYVEYTFDNSKLLFYFTADGRVDFRELIKELASEFKTRIELRQIGVRDEAKLVG